MNGVAKAGLATVLGAAVFAIGGYVYRQEHAMECGLGGLLGSAPPECNLASLSLTAGTIGLFVGIGVLIAGLVRR